MWVPDQRKSLNTDNEKDRVGEPDPGLRHQGEGQDLKAGPGPGCPQGGLIPRSRGKRWKITLEVIKNKSQA